MTAKPITENTLFYGDNLDILRQYIPDKRGFSFYSHCLSFALRSKYSQKGRRETDGKPGTA